MRTFVPPLLRAFKASFFVIILLGMFQSEATATHFRAGSITWQSVGTVAQPNLIKFKVTSAWRIGFTWPGSPALTVGATINSGYRVVLRNSNNTADMTTVPMNIKVTSINTVENYWEGEFEFTYNYPAGNFNYLVFFTQCCRLSPPTPTVPGLSNNADRDFRVETIVTIRTPANNSPVASLPAVINVPFNSVAIYPVPAVDPDGDAISLSLAAPSTFGGAALTQPTGLSVIPGTLNLQFNTAGKGIGTLWNGVLNVKDSKGATIALDVIFKIVGPSTPPLFTYPPTPSNGSAINSQPLVPISFSIRATDNDAGDIVTLNAAGVPSGASFSSVSGNPASTTFSWTPTAAQVGTYVVNFSARDVAGVTTNTTVTIRVSVDPEFIAPTLGDGSILCALPGDPITTTFTARDIDPLNRVSLSAQSGLMPGMVFSPALPTANANPATTNLSWTPTASQWGVRTLEMKATNIPGFFRTTSVTWIVNNPPVITSTPSVTTILTGQPFSYTIVATDANSAEGDLVSIEAAILPSFLTIVDNGDNTFTISGTPTLADAGPHDIEVELQDQTNHYNGTHCGHVHQSFTLTVNPCNLSLTLTPTPPACAGGTDGAIFCNVSGVNGTAVYAWSNGASTPNISGLLEGSYNLTVTDDYGCNITESTTLTAPLDVTKPVPDVAMLPTITGECAASVTAPTATDNCSGVITGTTTDATSFTAQGTYVINWSYDDGNGNVETQQQTVIIDDVTKPVPDEATLPTITGECGASATAPTATDNCSGPITGSTTDPTSFTAQGTYVINWSYDDGNGNVETQQQTVIVKDITPPVIVCLANVTINNTPGQCSGTTTLATPKVTDNCAVEMVANGNFNLQAAGWNACGNNVEAFGTELNYGGSNGSNRVAEIDHQPVTLCQSINGFIVGQTYQLSFLASRRVGFFPAPGTVGTIVTIDGGALNKTVNRSNATFNLTPETFSFVATQTTHTLSFVPTAGWSGTLGLIVDDISVNRANITNNAPATFPIGNTLVTFTATDAAGNTATCTQMVTVVDNEKPVPDVVTLPTVTGECSASVTAPTATDNCSGTITGSTIDPTSFTAQGTYVINWSYNDGNGNVETQQQTVIVKDVIPPVVLTQNISIELVNGVASIIAADVTRESKWIGYINAYFLPSEGGALAYTGVEQVADLKSTIDANAGTVTLQPNFSKYNASDPYWSNGAIGNKIVQSSTYVEETALVDQFFTFTGYVVSNTLAPGYDNYAWVRIFDQNFGLLYEVRDPLVQGQNFKVKYDFTPANTVYVQYGFTIQGLNANPADEAALGSVVVNAVTRLEDACGPTFSSIDVSSFDCSNLGPNTVMLTKTDVNGNSATRMATVTVLDKEPPVTPTLGDVTGECSVTVPIPTTTDICSGIINGTTGDPLTYSAQGSYVIHWTFTDAYGNSTTANQNVVVKDVTPPTISCVANSTKPTGAGLCTYSTVGNEFDPTAFGDNCSGATISNSYNNTSTLAGAVFPIGTTTVTWTVTDIGGNSTNCSFNVLIEDDQNPTNFIIYAQRDVNFHEYHYIGGDVGVTDIKGKADFKKNTVLNPYRITASSIKVQTPSAVNNQTLSPATGGPNPTFYPYDGNTSGLSNISVSTNTTLNGNWKDVTVKKGITATLTGNNFGKIDIEEGAVVTFTATVINVKELKVSKGKKNDNVLTIVNFANPASVKVKDKVTVEDDARVNVGGPKVTFYAGDITGGEEKFEVKGENSQVTGNIMIPNGKLHVHGGNDITRPTIMTGWYIIEKLDGHEKYVYWNKYNCSQPVQPIITGIESIKPATATAQKIAVPVKNDMLKVTVAPNPTSTYFTFRLQSEDETPVSIRIVNGTGQVLESANKVNSNGTIQMGSRLVNGMYFAEFMQGTDRQVIKVLKIGTR